MIGNLIRYFEQAVAFIAAQREMLVACLRSPVNLVSGIGIQEVHLVTTILRIALPLISDQEMVEYNNIFNLEIGNLLKLNLHMFL